MTPISLKGHLPEKMKAQSHDEESLDDLADEFCYEMALVLRRVLDLEEEEETDDESADD